MTIDELRKNYPFIAYGNQYQFWEKLTQWYSWLLERIVSERPAKSTDHDWVKLAICFHNETAKNSPWRLPYSRLNLANKRCSMPSK